VTATSGDCVVTDTRIVVQRFVDHFLAGRIVEGLSVLNEDGVYTIIGTTPVSGVYPGRQDLLDRLLPSLQMFSHHRFSLSDIIVEKDRAVVLASNNGEGPYGPYMQLHYAFVTRVAGDGFAEVIELNSTVAIEKALCGRQFVNT
jgi:uncharacterized protein